MSNKGSFELVVETRTYRNGIVTKEAGIVDDKTRYGLEKLSQALYTSVRISSARHAKLAVMDERGDE